MSDLKSHANTNYMVTAQQIVKLEHGLLSLRQSSKASPEAVDAIAAVQYQEILRLRAELDAAMGFEEVPSDIEVALSGPTIGIGTAPARAVSVFLTSLRGAMRAVTAYLMTGEPPGRGRLPRYVTRPAEIQFVGAASGSLRLKLNLPEPSRLFPESNLEQVTRSLRLMFEVVDWASSSEGIETLNAKVDDSRLKHLLLGQVQRIGPTPRSAIQRVALSSRLSDSSVTHILSRKSMVRIRNALQDMSKGAVSVTHETVTYPVALEASESELSG